MKLLMTITALLSLSSSAFASEVFLKCASPSVMGTISFQLPKADLEKGILGKTMNFQANGILPIQEHQDIQNMTATLNGKIKLVDTLNDQGAKISTSLIPIKFKGADIYLTTAYLCQSVENAQQ